MAPGVGPRQEAGAARPAALPDKDHEIPLFAESACISACIFLPSTVLLCYSLNCF